MNENLVSIITPSYNSEKFIGNAIESVISQIYKNWEMIITDDCSTDNTVDVIEKYCRKDNRVKLIRLENNRGPAIARNRSIEAAKGRYIAFLDADDQWSLEKLEKQIQFMQSNHIEFSYANYNTMDENGNKLKKIIIAPEKLNYRQLLKANKIGCLTVVYDTQRIGKVYMPLIRKRQDYGLWLNILQKVEYAYNVNEVLGTYRLLTNSLSSNKVDLLKYNYALFRNHENLTILESLYYLGWNILTKLKQ